MNSKGSMPFGRKVRRSLARRFPKTRRAYNWSYAKARHFAGRLWGGIKKIGSSITWSAGLCRAIWHHRSDKRLTVLVDVAAFWEPLTGIGWYLYRLLEHLADRDDLRILLCPPTIIHSPDIPRGVVDPPSGRALVLLRYEVPQSRVLFAGAVTRLLRKVEPLLLAVHRADILFAPNYFLPRRFSLARGRLVATIHDLGLHQVPWTLREETLDELSQSLDRTLNKAARIITVSAAVKAELIDYGFPRPQHIHVVHHGPGHLSNVTPGLVPDGISEPFALHVGTLEPRKNISMLLQAWRRLVEDFPAAPVLVLCGRFGWKADGLREEIAVGAEEGWLRHLGYVDEAGLAALYHAAALVLFPSLYEGFGLPAVEALWARRPLICSDLPVLREVAGEGACFVPPDSPDALAETARKLLTDESLRREIVENGQRQIDTFSWSRAAEETVAVWRQAAGTVAEDSA